MVVKGNARYDRIAHLGEGTFGIVSKAADSTKKEGEPNQIVAIKKIRLGHEKDGVSFTALREIKLLQEIQHPNVIGLLDVFAHKGSVHMVLEYCVTDLEHVIKDRKLLLTGGEIKCCMRMILEGVAACHKAWTLHRDLKPSNILVGADGELKLADFGLARIHASPDIPRLSPVVITRWYRPPELLYAAKKYGAAVDMWSVGCIFAELMLRQPYLPGNSDTEQLQLIYQARGTAKDGEWDEAKHLPGYIQFESVPQPDQKFIFSASTPESLDLLNQLMKLNPNDRISAEDALKHNYFTKEAPVACTAKQLAAKIRSGSCVKKEPLVDSD